MNPPLRVYSDWEKRNFKFNIWRNSIRDGRGIISGNRKYRTTNQLHMQVGLFCKRKQTSSHTGSKTFSLLFVRCRRFRLIADLRHLTFLFGIKDVLSQRYFNADCLSRIRKITSEPNENETETEYTRTFELIRNR